MNRRLTITTFFILFFVAAFSQTPRLSLSSDVSVQRSFKKEQRFWAFGLTTVAQVHLTPKNGIYMSFSYFSYGNFKNNLTATAKSPLTTIRQIKYVNHSRMNIQQFSLGWRKYLRGTSDAEDGWSLYSLTGLGILFGGVSNTHSVTIDTAKYYLPVLSGNADFKRLTLDLGLGWEVPVGGEVFFYTEGKVFLPTTDYPSKYIFVNNNAPLLFMLGAGFRVIF